MKNRFKLGTMFLLAFFFAACKKNLTTETSPTVNNPIHRSINSDPNGPNGDFEKSQVVYVNGEYLTNYGLGISFGSYFPYPLSVNSTDTGVPYYSDATGTGQSGGSTVLDYLTYTSPLGGTAFIVTYPKMGTTLSGDAYTTLHNYYTAFKNFVEQKKNSDSTLIQPILPSIPGSVSDYVITFRGQFVLDPLSPTNVSIWGMGYTNYSAPNED
jgi:hypothetical protein